MSRLTRLFLRTLTVTVDIVMTALAFYVAYELRILLPFPTRLILGPFRDYLAQLGVQIFSLVTTFFFYRLYHHRRNSSRIDQFYSILSAVSISMLVATALSYLVYRSDSDLTRGMIIYSWALSVPLITLGRGLTGMVRGAVRRHNPARMLLVGTGDVARMILQKTIQSPQLGYRVIGFVDGAESAEEVAGVPVLGTVSSLKAILEEYRPNEVIIALPEASHDDLLDIISMCEAHHATVRIFPDLFQIIASELHISDLDGLPLLTVRDIALRGWNLTLKRGMDLVFSAIGLVMLSPLLMLIALIVRLESKGPVFYCQERVGLDGNPFAMIKFRSMRIDAEAATGPVWAVEDDPRRTKSGKFLRESSLDEFPQLINVLLGDMSLVGPRPERPIFVDQFKRFVPRYMERHKEKAGITGWAQVNGLRGDTSIVERTKYDLYYIENWSLLFDLKILLRTLINQFRGDHNAY